LSADRRKPLQNDSPDGATLAKPSTGSRTAARRDVNSNTGTLVSAPAAAPEVVKRASGGAPKRQTRKPPRTLSDQLAEVKTELSTAIQQIDELTKDRDDVQKSIEALREEHQHQLDVLTDQHCQQMLQETKEHEQKLQQEIAKVIDQHSHEVNTLKSYHERNLHEAKLKYENDLKTCTHEHKEQLATLTASHEAAIQALTTSHDQQLREITDRFETIKNTLSVSKNASSGAAAYHTSNGHLLPSSERL
jgi:chromosome segregation ATPase